MTASAVGSPAQATVFSLFESVLPPVLTALGPMPLEAVASTAEVAEHPTLPLELLQRLGLTIDLNATPLEIAGKMRAYSLQILRSTENQIAVAMQTNQPLGDIADARILLLRLAVESPDADIRAGAAALASHIEGQQLINAGTAQTDLLPPIVPPAYIAIPFAVMGEQSLIELRLWPRDERRAMDDTDEDACPIRAVLRLTLGHLGRIQADIAGGLTDVLRCRLSAERPAVSRLLSQNAGRLAEQLAQAGWTKNEVTCRPQIDWPPLWNGGEELAVPRKRVDGWA